MDCEGEPVVIIWCSGGGVTSEMISDPGVRLLKFRDNSELKQLDWGAKVKTFSGSGSDGSDVDSDGVKPGWPAREGRFLSFFVCSEID